LGDFVKVEHSAGTTEIVRIDQIFIHNPDRKGRVFPKVTDTDSTFTDFDVLLQYPRLTLLQSDDIKILGLPALLAHNLYILLVTEDIADAHNHPLRVPKLLLGRSDGTSLLWVQQSLQWFIMVRFQGSKA
jgi:hypothetical protein